MGDGRNEKWRGALQTEKRAKSAKAVGVHSLFAVNKCGKMRRVISKLREQPRRLCCDMTRCRQRPASTVGSGIPGKRASRARHFANEGNNFVRDYVSCIIIDDQYTSCAVMPHMCISYILFFVSRYALP